MWNKPTDRQLSRLPSLYTNEGNPDPLVRMHFFLGPCDWWVTEYNPEDREFFGFVSLGDPEMAEWGYISYDELLNLRQRRVIEVDRDLYFAPRPASQVLGIVACRQIA